ncbi:hypothetical protein [Streptomyces novaecaesareae]|uniref:hypothetical protein n=1 Tax=Streptomyces novaecaesareae TaxID=68244 RepID=UPI0004AAC149|nr:hypothetical protein [Streptomyces novaecaesareae]
MNSDHIAAPARSDLGRAYRERLARDAVRIDDLTGEATADRLLRITYRGRLLPTPVFLSAAERAALVRDLGTVHRLLTELPQRLHDGSVGALADALGLTPSQRRQRTLLLKPVLSHRGIGIVPGEEPDRP